MQDRAAVDAPAADDDEPSETLLMQKGKASDASPALFLDSNKCLVVKVQVRGPPHGVDDGVSLLAPIAAC